MEVQICLEKKLVMHKYYQFYANHPHNLLRMLGNAKYQKHSIHC